MSKYIDSNKFRELLGDMRAEYNFFDDEERPRYEAYSKALLILNEYIENEPSVDIVFCKECKYSSYDGTYGCMADHFNGLDDVYHRMYADDFCSRGERSE